MSIFRQERRGTKYAEPLKHHRVATVPEAGPALPLCHVFIAADGTVAVDGSVISVHGDSPQATVLGQLHQRALALTEPVEAYVLDQRGRSVLRIRVYPNGASEFLEPPLPFDDLDAPPPKPPSADPAPDWTTSRQATGPSAPSMPIQLAPQQSYKDTDTAIPKVIAAIPPTPKADASKSHIPAGSHTEPRSPNTERAVEPAPHGADINSPKRPAARHTSGPVRAAIPRELADAVAAVSQAVADSDLSLARAHTNTLKEQATREFGADHEYALEACNLAAYVAHLRGDHGKATALSLHVANLRHHQGDPRASEDIERACATWELITSPHNAVPLGTELLKLWNLISEGDGSEGHQAVERRLSAFSRVSPPAFAARKSGMTTASHDHPHPSQRREGPDHDSHHL